MCLSLLSTRDSDEVRVGIGMDLINCIRITTWQWSEGAAATMMTQCFYDKKFPQQLKNLMIQWLADNPVAQWLNASTTKSFYSNSRTWWSNGLRITRQRNDTIPLWLKVPTATWGLDDSMAYRQSDDAMTQCPTTRRFCRKLTRRLYKTRLHCQWNQFGARRSAALAKGLSQSQRLDIRRLM